VSHEGYFDSSPEEHAQNPRAEHENYFRQPDTQQVVDAEDTAEESVVDLDIDLDALESNVGEEAQDGANMPQLESETEDDDEDRVIDNDADLAARRLVWAPNFRGELNEPPRGPEVDAEMDQDADAVDVDGEGDGAIAPDLMDDMDLNVEDDMEGALEGMSSADLELHLGVEISFTSNRYEGTLIWSATKRMQSPIIVTMS